MAAKYYFTSADLVASVKRKISAPDSQSYITDDEILDFANEEMENKLVSMITKRHEDYFLTREDLPLESGKNKYEIPYRAIGSKIRELAYTPDQKRFDGLNRITIDEVTSTREESDYNKFYIQNESMVLFTDTGNIGSDGHLAVFYNIRPNSLVSSDQVAIITGIDATSGIISIDSIPSGFSVENDLDFIKTRSPHRILGYDVRATDINTSGKTITLAPADIPEDLKIGDRVTLAGETDIINCPSELHSFLAELVAAKILEANGDIDNLNVVDRKIQKMEDNLGDLLDNRVDGSPIKVKARNNLLRRRGSRRGRR